VIKSGERILLDRMEIPLENLRDKLKAIFRTKRDPQVYIQADKVVSYGFVAAAMGEIKAAGIRSIGLVTLPKSVAPSEGQ
jgi:biopolymer transport protein TolR